MPEKKIENQKNLLSLEAISLAIKQRFALYLKKYSASRWAKEKASATGNVNFYITR
jgi:hypothetical protein